MKKLYRLSITSVCILSCSISSGMIQQQKISSHMHLITKNQVKKNLPATHQNLQPISPTLIKNQITEKQSNPKTDKLLPNRLQDTKEEQHKPQSKSVYEQLEDISTECANIDQSNTQPEQRERLHNSCMIIKPNGDSCNSYEKLKQDFFTYAQGYWTIFGDAILHGSMHSKVGITSKAPSVDEVVKYYDWNYKLITLGHHVDRVICEIIQHTLDQDSNAGLGHLFRHTKACDKHQYKISNDTLIFLIVALAYREKRKLENHQQFVTIQSNLRTNITQPSALTIQNPKKNNVTCFSKKKSKISSEHLAYIEKIISDSTERIKSFAKPIQKSTYIPQCLNKLWGEAYRRTLGDESFKEHLLNGTLEQCITDFKPCHTYKVKKLFEYLKGEASESIDEDDIKKVFSMLRSRITLGHEADRIVRSLVSTALKDYRTPKSNTSIGNLSKTVAACNRYGYYLHGYTAKLVAKTLDHLSKYELNTNEEFDDIQNKLRTIVSDFQKEELASETDLNDITEHDKQQLH